MSQELILKFRNTKDSKAIYSFLKVLKEITLRSQVCTQPEVYLQYNSRGLFIASSLADMFHTATYQLMLYQFQKQAYMAENYNQDEDVIYQFETMDVLRFLNPKIVKKFSNLGLRFINSHGEYTLEIVMLQHFSENQSCQGTLSVPFKKEWGTFPCLDNVRSKFTIVNVCKIPEQIAKYAPAKYENIWMEATAEGIRIKKRRDNKWISEVCFKKEKLGNYDFLGLKEKLNNHIYFCGKDQEMFAFLHQYSKEKNHSKLNFLLMLDELNPTEFKYAFAYLQGVSEFYKIQRFFQIHLGTSIGNQTTVVVQPRPVRMYQGEDLLKTEEENPDRLRKIILNQYIGEDEIKEETLRMRKEHTNRIKEEKEVSASKVKKFQIE